MFIKYLVLKSIIYSYLTCIWRLLWCNGYHCKKWTVCFSHRANTLGKGINPTTLPLAMGKIVRQTGLFILDMATSLGEGELHQNLLNSLKKWPCIASCSCRGIGVCLYIYIYIYIYIYTHTKHAYHYWKRCTALVVMYFIFFFDLLMRIQSFSGFPT